VLNWALAMLSRTKALSERILVTGGAVHYSQDNKVAGYLELEKAKVRR